MGKALGRGAGRFRCIANSWLGLRAQPSSAVPSRARLVLSRWLSVTACGAVAAALVLLFEPLALRLGEPIASWLGGLPPAEALVLVAVPTLAVCWAAGRKRWRGFLGLRFFHSYPPLWVAILVGYAGFLLGHIWVYGVDSAGEQLSDVTWFLGASPRFIRWPLLLGLPLLALLTFRRDVAALVAPADTDKLAAALARDFQSLRAWLCDDAEVTDPREDRFHRCQIARRIARRVRASEADPTTAIIGALGSGKSTIKNFVAHYLRREPKILMVDVSAWHFDSSEAAVGGILRALVRELGRHVNVLPLVGLPGEYAATIERAAGRYGAFASLLRGLSQPAEVLRHISDIACAADLKIVLWVEDLERFSGADQLPEDGRAFREAERLGPIRALLHLLDRYPSVSVVTSDVSLRTRFDLGKIARFVEDLPAIDESDARLVVEVLCRACAEGYPRRVITPFAPGEGILPPNTGSARAASNWLSDYRGDPDVLTSIMRILRTPRDLKSALRRALETWEAMPGEIEFDAVLVASAVQTARPGLFTLLSDNIEPLRRGLTNPIRLPTTEKKPHGVVQQIEEMLKGDDETVGAAFRRLIGFLFRHYPPDGPPDANNTHSA
jgi:Arc/MetJ family transcription regulator